MTKQYAVNWGKLNEWMNEKAAEGFELRETIAWDGPTPLVIMERDMPRPFVFDPPPSATYAEGFQSIDVYVEGLLKSKKYYATIRVDGRQYNVDSIQKSSIEGMFVIHLHTGEFVLRGGATYLTIYRVPDPPRVNVSPLPQEIPLSKFRDLKPRFNWARNQIYVEVDDNWVRVRDIRYYDADGVFELSMERGGSILRDGTTILRVIENAP